MNRDKLDLTLTSLPLITSNVEMFQAEQLMDRRLQNAFINPQQCPHLHVFPKSGREMNRYHSKGAESYCFVAGAGKVFWMEQLQEI